MNKDSEDAQTPIKTLDEYINRVFDIRGQWYNCVLAFRGQRDCNWDLESSAQRRLKASLSREQEISDGLFINYHEDLINRCKLSNFDRRDGERLNDLELLADLQHNRAATCLSDFTSNALVALWFGCEGSPAHTPETNGKVFVVNIADETAFQEIAPTDIEGMSIRKVLEFRTRDSDTTGTDSPPTEGGSQALGRTRWFWHWTPANLNERIIAQDSLFVFAPISSGQPDTEEIEIHQENKERMRQDLRELFNIHEQSLFPDFVGFAYTNRHDAAYDTSAPESYRRVIRSAQRGTTSESIQELNRVIELDPLDPEGYNNRAVTYLELGDWDRAIKDFGKAIELDPEYTDAYYNRGAAYFDRNEFGSAVTDFSKTIDLDPEYGSAYFFRGMTWVRLEQWDKVESDFIAAETLGLDLASEFAKEYPNLDAFEQQTNVRVPDGRIRDALSSHQESGKTGR